MILVATISAGLSALPVEFNPAWTAKGQHWRIEKEITDHIDGAAAQAERLRGEIGDLEQRVADAARRIAEPFPRAAELEAARSRRDAIEHQIRDAATTPDDTTETWSSAMPGEVDDDLASVTFHDDLGLAGLGQRSGHHVLCAGRAHFPGGIRGRRTGRKRARNRRVHRSLRGTASRL